VGIEPDVFIELDEGYYEIEEPTDEDDNQLMKALEIIKEQLE
jgi:C-terminal processing protease CtpA/Prc